MNMKNSENILAKMICFYFASLFFMANTYANELDPLSTLEADSALSLSTPRMQRSQVQGQHTNELELLLIERRPTDKDNPGKRLADIYRYDYEHDETLHTIIDLDQQKIISNKRHQFLQLPLTANEINRSTNIIFNDEEQLRLLRNEYQRITGKYLSTPEQLHIKAFSFSASTMPEQLNAASKQCGLNRCAQILLYTHESIVFEVSPIVNLSAEIVTQNIGY